MKKGRLRPKTLLKLISKNAPDMLWVKDLKKRYLYANDTTCRDLLIANPDEIMGKTDLFFENREKQKHKDDKNWHTFGRSCTSSDKEVIKALKPIKFLEYGTIQGKMTYLRVAKAPFFDKNNKVIGIIGSARDVTEEIKLKEKNNYLIYFDQLTSLPNRQKIILDISQKNPTACMIFNIDDFRESCSVTVTCSLKNCSGIKRFFILGFSL